MIKTSEYRDIKKQLDNMEATRATSAEAAPEVKSPDPESEAKPSAEKVIVRIVINDPKPAAEPADVVPVPEPADGVLVPESTDGASATVSANSILASAQAVNANAEAAVDAAAVEPAESEPKAETPATEGDIAAEKTAAATVEAEEAPAKKAKKAPFNAGPGIIKALFVVVLAVFLLAVYRYNDAGNVSIEEIQAAMVDRTSITDMAECDARDLRQFMELDSSMYESFVYYRNTEALSVEEMLIVKVPEKSMLNTVQDAVDKRIENQLTAFESYGPEQVKLLKNAVIMKRGEYLFYCVARDPYEYEEVFRDVI